MSKASETRASYLTSKTLGECFQQSHERGRAGLPIVSLTMDQGLLPRDQIDRRVESNLPPEGHRLVRKGDLAYNMMRMWQGVCYSAKYDCLTSPAYVVLRPQCGIDSAFAEYYLRFEDTVAEFKRLSFGVVDDRLRLYFHDFASVKCAIPTSNITQRKIARILTTLDNVIAQTEALIAKYQAIKQGLMHDLFTRGVDATCKLRPPQSEAPELYKHSDLGWIPKEWEVTTVGDVLTCIDAGKSPDCPDQPATSGEWGVLKVSAVQPDGFRSIENKLVQNTTWVNPTYEVHDGDLLMSRCNTYQLVGLVCLVRSPQPRLMICDKTLRLRVDAKRATVVFLFWLMQQPVVRRHIEIHATGTSGSMKNISQPSIRSAVIMLPSVTEQTQISRRIEAIEQRIRSERRIQDKLRTQKTGLMQDLLTGKVRVNVEAGMENDEVEGGISGRKNAE